MPTYQLYYYTGLPRQKNGRPETLTGQIIGRPHSTMKHDESVQLVDIIPEGGTVTHTAFIKKDEDIAPIRVVGSSGC